MNINIGSVRLIFGILRASCLEGRSAACDVCEMEKQMSTSKFRVTKEFAAVELPAKLGQLKRERIGLWDVRGNIKAKVFGGMRPREE